ncbi:DMT family transporter [Deinococcus cellulosilyticus]|uniref:Multidrug transporter n=1 Tax=Deinococcus cellulosilyticus (strain DSM 18568 / NBRC 106333 / KACC 11606 / 5516J-15) TaxID=1223518 RepID=A0A511MX71_DEIC1|nr:multidrug efflux SMR transporter [Deinococcus cellulosilyticus]GEM45182.1 multidrug transporter [Deinococcus cellulosilyticus NBRC 106333 = KACC 11606]
MNSSYIYLFLAIFAEIIGTSALKASDGFTKWLPSTLVVVGYATAFYLLSLSLKNISIGTAYAIWSGLGTAGIVLIGTLFLKESLDLPKVLGIALIIAGVVVLNVFSKAH